MLIYALIPRSVDEHKHSSLTLRHRATLLEESRPEYGRAGGGWPVTQGARTASNYSLWLDIETLLLSPVWLYVFLLEISVLISA